VGGGNSYAEAIADLKAFGAPEDVIAELEVLQQTEDFEVWPENWDVVHMFLRMQTQWRTSAAGLLGLDYNVAKWIFDLYDLKDHKETLEGLQIMEAEVLVALNEDADGS